MAASKFNDNKYDISVYDPALSRDGFSEDGLISSGCLVFVYDAGTKTLSTIYSDGLRTALVSPISRAQFATDGKIKFYGPNSSYDIVVNDDKGNLAVYAGVTPVVHSVAIKRDGTSKVLVFPMIYNSGGTVVDTGLDLPYKCLVTDAAVEVVDVDSTETVDIGLLAGETAGDADGFIAAISVATAGYINPVGVTAGGNETFYATNKYGVLLGTFLAGSDVDKDNGLFQKSGHFVTGSNAKSIVYTPSSSDTFTGFGYVYFTVVR